MICRIHGGRLRASAANTTPPVDPNLLALLPWIEGANTTMTISAGRVRATNNGGNPRVYKSVSGLTIGASYHMQGSCYPGNGTSSYFFRVSTSPAIPDGDVVQETNDTGDIPVNETFVSPSTSLSIGVVGIRGPGEFCEIDENFSMVLVP